MTAPALPARFPGARGPLSVETLAAALRGRHVLADGSLFLQAGDGLWQVTPARPDELAAQILAAIGADLAGPEAGQP